MLKFLQKDNPLLIPLLFILNVLLWINEIIHPIYVSGVFENNPMPLYQLVLLLPVKASWWIASILSLLVLIQGFLLNNLSSKFRLIDQGTYLPGILFVVFVSSFHQLHQLNPLVFANIFLLFSLHVIFPTYRIEKTIDPFFISMFLISVGSLFYFPLIFFAIALFYFMLNTRSFYWREWVVAILGLITPYLFAFSAFFMYGKTLVLLQIIQHQLVDNASTIVLDFRYLAFFIFLSLIMVTGSVFLYRNVLKKVVTRKYYSLLFFIWLQTFTMYVLFPSIYLESIFLFSIPFAFYIANNLISTKSRLAENIILYGSLLLVIFLNNI
jgi:hypothetical protein